ncbi:tryptophan synthase subunit alpha [Mesobacillus jeotgali]|jgi:tryptophan synthase alpha chain|uniref:Tryptophan synthase alpha chain n=1 Tax=Mesobacillus jeotgali TaxID=129985 RepID=A0ABY9VBV3_9BACI|nr:tryptophan synthase subunit alpha [Mesobacillus jeotgali]WNF21290.1 tryptophan synthase subunit alpha [Mesobacillus jeotgali]
MDKIKKALTEKGKKAFIPYIMAGDGGLETLEEKLLYLQECGADAIEIGIPFSDPVADGPTIQKAGIRALRSGTTLRKVLETIQTFKNEISVPLILMTYMNPLVAYGIEKFAEDAAEAGISGCIIPDLPIEEENFVLPAFEQQGISLIRLVTLTTPVERIREIGARATGFIYAVTVTGITGARNNFSKELAGFLDMVKKSSSVPVLAGFGVSSEEQVREVCQHCDGVIVGSKIIDLLEQNDLAGIKQLVSSAEEAGLQIYK